MRILIAAILILSTALIVHADDNWRTLVNDQVKHSRSIMRTDTVDVLTISIMLEKDGDEKDRDTTRTRIYYDGDDQLVELYGDDGVLVETQREPRPAGSVTQAGILSMFDIENADVFTLTDKGYDDTGRLIVDFAPNEPADSLFAGTAFIDTSAWFPARMEITMSELPDKVKEMTMVAYFAPGEDGVYRPSFMTADGRAKWLLLNFYFRTETKYAWKHSPGL